MTTEQNAVSNALLRIKAAPQALYLVAAILIICVVLSFLSEAFLTPANLLNVLRQASTVFLLAAGLTFVLIAGGFDLSIGANLGLSAGVAGTVMVATGSPLIGAAAGLAVSGLVGLGNGLLVTLLRLPPFIATYGTLWIVHGLTYYYMAGGTVGGFKPEFRFIGTGYVFGVPFPIIIMLLVCIAGSWFATRTTYGRDIFAIGSNSTAAKFSGIKVNSRQILVYVLSGLAAGIASLVFLARINSVEGDIGEGLLLPAVAAAVIGGVSLFGGVGSLWGTLAGAIILTLIINGMNLLSINANWQPLVTGAVILVAILLDFSSRRSKEGV